MNRRQFLYVWAMSMITLGAYRWAGAAAVPPTSKLLPTPLRLTPGHGKLNLASNAVLQFSDLRIELAVTRFIEDSKRLAGVDWTTGTISSPDVKGLRIVIGPVADLDAIPLAVGESPAGASKLDERYALTVDAEGIRLRASTPNGVVCGLSTVLQLLATSPVADSGLELAFVEITDGPRFAWRSHLLDVSRTYFTVEEIKRVIDWLAFYKFNVLHLHLTDDQAWRIEAGRLPGAQPDGEPIYTREELGELIKYAASRYIVIVPEADAPGHVSSLLKLRPELVTDRNVLRFEVAPGIVHYSSWLDPDLPATFKIYDEVIAYLADVFPGPHLHIGGDEPLGMPDEPYTKFAQHMHKTALGHGKRVIGYQEVMRAGIDHDIMVQNWITTDTSFHNLDLNLPQLLKDKLIHNVELGLKDMSLAQTHGLPILMTPFGHAYLDVPYKESSSDPDQEGTRKRVGQFAYRAQTTREFFDWEPAKSVVPDEGHVVIGGVGCAIWNETTKDFKDLMFLMMPRLVGIAQRAWADPKHATWDNQATVLPYHGRLWTKEGLNFYRSSLVKWTP